MERTIADELVGAEVEAVQFIRDYVSLHLAAETGEPTIGGSRTRGVYVHALTDPQVNHEGRQFAKGDSGWRDTLCELINARVRHATIVEGVEFRIEFDSGASFIVSLRSEDYDGRPEAVNVKGLDFWAL